MNGCPNAVIGGFPPPTIKLKMKTKRYNIAQAKLR